MTEITRFDMDMDGSMEPSEHGQWVRYEDIQQRTWVGLTDEEMNKCAGESPWTPNGLKCVRDIEAKLKEKNT